MKKMISERLDSIWLILILILIHLMIISLSVTPIKRYQEIQICQDNPDKIIVKDFWFDTNCKELLEKHLKTK